MKQNLKEQIETLKTKDFLDEYWHFGYHHGNKELNFKIFKAKAAHILNDVDEQLFEKILVQKYLLTILKKIKTKFTNKMNVVSLLYIQPINVVIYSMLLKLF